MYHPATSSVLLRILFTQKHATIVLKQAKNIFMSSENNQQQLPQGVDLFRAFFRTPPSILTTVLPTSIHYAVENLKQKEHQQQEQEQIANNNNAKTVSELNTEFKKYGIEYIPESTKFKFLASHVAEDPKDRAPVNAATLSRASEIIKQNANAERKRREKLSQQNVKKAKKELARGSNKGKKKRS